jgi:hypothetical protein
MVINFSITKRTSFHHHLITLHNKSHSTSSSFLGLGAGDGGGTGYRGLLRGRLNFSSLNFCILRPINKLRPTIMTTDTTKPIEIPNDIPNS